MQVKDFEILSQETGTKIHVWGRTLEDLFSNALRGMAALMYPEILRSGRSVLKEKSSIRVQAVDISSLLVEFLSLVVAKSDLNNTVFKSVRFLEFGENFLSGELSGKKINSFDLVIKDVSYDVNIARDAARGLYETVLLFEV